MGTKKASLIFCVFAMFSLSDLIQQFAPLHTHKKYFTLIRCPQYNNFLHICQWFFIIFYWLFLLFLVFIW